MIEGALRAAAENASLAIGGVAVLIVAWGSIEAAIGCIALVVRRQTGHGARKGVWRRYGVWLLLGLEFELAADIIEPSSRLDGWTSRSSARLRSFARS